MKDMFNKHYILDGKGNPVAADLMTWARWFEKAERRVKLDQIGKYQVSTVFLGLDYNYGHEGPPVVWETMVFRNGSAHDIEMDRCSGSREQAEAMHQKMVKLVKEKYATQKEKDKSQ